MKRTTMMMTILAGAMLAGCGGPGEQQNRDFFTSGNRDADQRAEQRMAKDQQLNAKQNATGDKEKANNANRAEAKKSLYERLGSESGVYAIVDDWVTRVLADPRVNWE